jgi:hypothetical protein
VETAAMMFLGRRAGRSSVSLQASSALLLPCTHRFASFANPTFWLKCVRYVHTRAFTNHHDVLSCARRRFRGAADQITLHSQRSTAREKSNA